MKVIIWGLSYWIFSLHLRGIDWDNVVSNVFVETIDNDNDNNSKLQDQYVNDDNIIYFFIHCNNL